MRNKVTLHVLLLLLAFCSSGCVHSLTASGPEETTRALAAHFEALGLDQPRYSVHRLPDATYMVSVGDPRIDQLAFLEGYPISVLHLKLVPITDLSFVRRMPLKRLILHTTGITDLSPLSGIPLTELWMDYTKVDDLSPLEGMPLTRLSFSAEHATKGFDAVRSCKTLRRINGTKPSEFWSAYDGNKLLRQRSEATGNGEL